MVERLRAGHRETTRMVVTADLIDRFIELSGDTNPLHVDARVAREYGFPQPVAHGALTVAALSRLIGTQLPGAGAMWMSQSIEWLAPVFVGDEIDVSAVVRRNSEGTGVVVLDVEAINQRGERVMSGEARVKVLTSLAGAGQLPDANRVALVVGGSRGIGAAVVRRFAHEGYCVVINCRSATPAAVALRDEVAASGHEAALVPADVTGLGAATSLAEQALSAFGRIDIVVHCATPPVPAEPLLQTTFDRVDEYLRAYVASTLELVRATAPGMAQRKFGRYVILGTSYIGGAPPPGLSAYVVAKSGAWGLVKSIAVELGPMGITANMVSPSIVVTDLTATIPARSKEVEARRSPMRRLPQVEEVAQAVAFLVSDAAGYINGINLPMVGGPA